MALIKPRTRVGSENPTIKTNQNDCTDLLKLVNEKVKHFTTNTYVYLTHAYPKSNENFAPYNLIEVPFPLVNKLEYYTISKNGFTYWSLSENHFTELDVWLKEYEIYCKLRKLKTFYSFRLWKGFKVWEKTIKWNKFHETSRFLTKNLFTAQPILNRALQNLNDEYERLRHSKFVNTDVIHNWNILDFIEHEMSAYDDLRECLLINRTKIQEMLYDACSDAIMGQGFSLERRANRKFNTPAKFSEISRRENFLDRLQNFLRLIDYITISFLHELLINTFNDLSSVFQSHTDLGPTFETMKENLETDSELESQRPTGKLEEPLMNVNVLLTENGIDVDPSRYVTLNIVNQFTTLIMKTTNDVKRFQDDLHFSVLIEYSNIGKMAERCGVVTPDFSFIINSNDQLISDLNSISDNINVAYDKFEAYITRFERILNTFKLESKTDEKIIINERDIVVLNQYCERYNNEMKLLEKIRPYCNLGLLKLNQKSFRASLMAVIEHLQSVSFNSLPELILLKLNDVDPKAINILSNLMALPEETDDIVQSLYYLDNASKISEDVEVEVNYVRGIFSVMERFEVPQSSNLESRFANTENLMLRVRESLQNKLNDRHNIVNKLDISLQNDIMKLLNEVTDIREEIQQPWLLDAESNIIDVLGNLNSALDRIAVLQKLSAEFNKYQEEFEIDEAKFEDLDLLLEEVQSRQLLWESFQEWSSATDSWYTTPFQKLNVDEIKTLNFKILNNCVLLRDKLPENLIIPRIQSKAEDFKEKLPVLACLRNPTLRKRHWARFEQILHRKIALDNTLTLDVFEQLHAFDEQVSPDLLVVSTQASGEEALEVRLRNLAMMWKEQKLTVEPHEAIHNVFVLTNLTELDELLDESRINIMIVASSEYVDPVRERVAQWTGLLNQFNDTLEEWRNCQTAWIQLSAIFAAPDMQRQLPHESQMFMVVDRCWKIRMREVREKPLALDNMTDMDIFRSMRENNRLLDIITQCLEAYLEIKRLSFPRFFFLSNDELMELLSLTSKPHSMQGFLHKCIDAIQSLEFVSIKNNRNNEVSYTNDIVSIISPEGERIELEKVLKARGPVEDWFGKLEKVLRTTLKLCMKNAFQSYSLSEVSAWFKNHPSQTVLVVTQQQWAADVHSILDNKTSVPGIQQLSNLEGKLSSGLKKLTEIARSDITKLLRNILSALIIVLVHSKDTIKNLIEKQVVNSSDFDWQKIFRYYWETEPAIMSTQIGLSSFSYYYEYLGACGLLVNTPLTDRCYFCLMGAFQMNLGCSVSGTAGSGKTEIVKDIAKALAIRCIVFNCSESMNCRMFSRFLSGLVTSGAWCCFDEFNKIQIEILSVVGQQLSVIRNAKQKSMKRFMFDGREIPFVMSCSVFLTINPSNVKRTELPDNLKTLFRPISMMVPDYALIAEVILYSEGFENSRILAQKMVQMYKLCSEQLSQQDHYDFGMRAVKSVLVMAGALKRASPDQIEDITLICALRDSNLPKFLSDDAGLFKGILGDLFPGIDLPVVDYGKLREAIEFCMAEVNLQLVPELIAKNIQLYETMAVRWGVMLVGPTGSGKTKVLHTLGAALGKLWRDGVDGVYYRNVVMRTMNPKSISSDELYGAVNLSTMEWKDGLLGLAVRAAVNVKDEEHQWVVCDGPVDAVWIENLNTVLDDNKMLCLANSERIKLTAWVHMVFEVQDLAQASPATVSRCGMVYIDPLELGWLPLVKSWIVTLTEYQLRTEYKDILINLFKTHFEKILIFVRRKCKYSIHQVEVSKLSMMLTLLQALIKTSGINNSDILEARSFLHKIFIWCTLWSIGGNLMDESRVILESLVRSMFKDNQFSNIPDEDLWSYRVNTSNCEWESWASIVPVFEYNPNIPFFDMLVPTTDTARFGQVAELLFKEGYPVMFTGDTGVGKSVLGKAVLLKLQKLNVIPVFLNLSAQTSSPGTQDLIEARLERRKKTFLGAPMGKKLIYFVDDVNMPKLDTYGSQATIELLRQFLDFKGLYDRDKWFFKNFVDVTLGAACVPATGGRNPLTPRFVRHFGVMHLPSPSNITTSAIFGAVITGFLSDFAAGIKELSAPIAQASVDIYERLRKDFRPTPAKSHYVFNLRDLTKCIQGLMQASSSNYTAPIQIQRLFYHEVIRVFHDRLVDNIDKESCRKLIVDACEKSFGTRIVKDDELVLFGDFMQSSRPTGNGRIYDELKDIDKLYLVLEKYLDDYNSSNGHKIHIVLIEDAVQHIARISRLLRLEHGHCLLVGVAAIGKYTLSRLAAFMNGLKWFEIGLTIGYDRTAFITDLRKLYHATGVLNISHALVLSDTRIKLDDFLEEINSILVSGEIHNLFEAEEYENIITQIRKEAETSNFSDLSREGIHKLFISKVRSNLHVVLCMSMGDSFRRRLRMFPALLSYCTIDWFDKWPPSALLCVAKGYFSKVIDDEHRCDSLSKVCVAMHEVAERTSDRFGGEIQRYYYPTTNHFLDVVEQYKELLNLRTKAITVERDRIGIGLDKLIETAELVDVMEEDKDKAIPLLEEQQKRVKSIQEKLQEDNIRADVMRNAVSLDEEQTKMVKDETESIANEVERELETGLPALISAQDALKTINKTEVSDLRLISKPPKLVQFVLEAVCILLGSKTDWASAKTLIADPNFLKRLKDLDKEHMPDAIHRKIRTYVDDPNFSPVLLEKVSKVGKSMCVWVIAIDSYVKIYKNVEPKMRKRDEARHALNKVLSVLKVKQSQLSEIEGIIEDLNTNLTQQQRQLKDLQLNYNLTSVRLVRARRLTALLETEQIRWRGIVNDLNRNLSTVTGDSLLASGVLSYLGAYPKHLRDEMISLWLESCKTSELSVANEFNLVEILGDKMKINEWHMNNLPKDFMSIENGIIIALSKRWPLVIDPQEQANLWFRKMEYKNGLKIIRINDPNIMEIFKNAIQLGLPVLLEDIIEDLDIALLPILAQRIERRDGETYMKLGNNDITYNNKFKLYMTTKARNSHFSLNICKLVNVVNFSVCPIGLENQLHLDIVRIEQPVLSKQKIESKSRMTDIQEQKISLENRILEILQTYDDNLLDEVDLMESLDEVRSISLELEERIEEVNTSDKSIIEIYEKYRPLAALGALLFSVVDRLSDINPMYQFGLKYFIRVFCAEIEKEGSDMDIPQRLKFLQDAEVYAIYADVSRSLFTNHKLVFSFLLAIEVSKSNGDVSNVELDYFLRGPIATGVTVSPKPSVLNISDNQWVCAIHLQHQFVQFNGLVADLEKKISIDLDDLHMIFECGPTSTQPAEKDWNALSAFQKLMLIASLRDQILVNAIRSYVRLILGKQFIDSQQDTSMPSLFVQTSSIVPFVFILSTGSDPMSTLVRFAQENYLSEKLHCISLGEEQGSTAEALIEKGRREGHWIFLQNCHLAIPWLGELEQLIKEIALDDNAPHDGFRLYLSSMPDKKFPISILRNSVKTTVESPKGLRANLLRSLDEMFPYYFEDHILERDWKSIILGLCMFHGVVLERRKFGALGWNITYEFTESDRECALRTLDMFCSPDKPGKIPWDALEYINGEITYGGRVTDSWDLRCLRTILKTFSSSRILVDNYKYSETGIYRFPNAQKLEAFREYASSLPFVEIPEIFGMHENANLVFQTKETRFYIETLLEGQPRVSGGEGAASSDDICLEMIEKIRLYIPRSITTDDVFPALTIIDSKGRVPSLTTVMFQEVERFNRMLSIIHDSLANLQKAIKGFIVMSENLEEIFHSFLNNQVPPMWHKRGFLSTKSLGNWILDFQLRLEYMQAWVNNGLPKSSWICGLFFPQSFITGTLHTHARKHNLPLDSLKIDFEVLEPNVVQSDIFERRSAGMSEGSELYQGLDQPEIGMNIHGLFIEGGHWDSANGGLCDARLGELTSRLPAVRLIPCSKVEIKDRFEAPLYKTPTRRNIEYHSNFITSVFLDSQLPPDFWILRGTVLVTMITD